MTSRLSYLIAGAALLLVAASCEKEDNETIPVLTLDKTVWTVTGGTQNVQIAATSTWVLEVVYTNGQPSGWIHFSPAAGEGFAVSQMTVDPNDGEARQATVVLRSPKYSATKAISQVGSVVGDAPLWMELPALEGANCTLLVHDMSGGRYESAGTSGVRNWSGFWDTTYKLSHWVAYPLNKGLIGKGSRSNAWGLDPLLPAAEQPDVTVTYGGGWTRGHQIPSADRLDYAANVSTFYGTNMTPQDYDFNEDIWADLEGQVRSYAASCDTLYVVTGCDIRGYTQTSGDKTGFRVPVPVAYYKALLRKKGNDYSAVGYLLPHDNSISKGDYRDYICSIDQLEVNLDMDFFVNLPVVLGKEKADAIEAADPVMTVKNW